MTIAHATAARTAAADLIVDRIDAGSGAGRINIYTSGDVLMGYATFADPAFAAASNGSASMTPGAIVATISLAGTNIAAKFKVVDSDANEVFNGSVGTSGADLNLTSATFNQNDTLTLNSITYTAMP
jgi:hypothetical protein